MLGNPYWLYMIRFFFSRRPVYFRNREVWGDGPGVSFYRKPAVMGGFGDYAYVYAFPGTKAAPGYSQMAAGVKL